MVRVDSVGTLFGVGKRLWEVLLINGRRFPADTLCEMSIKELLSRANVRFPRSKAWLTDLLIGLFRNYVVLWDEAEDKWQCVHLFNELSLDYKRGIVVYSIGQALLEEGSEDHILVDMTPGRKLLGTYAIVLAEIISSVYTPGAHLMQTKWFGIEELKELIGVSNKNMPKRSFVNTFLPGCVDIINEADRRYFISIRSKQNHTYVQFLIGSVQ
jgi:hypothetical protein